MAELPTKKTLDDIERFGVEFSNGFTALQTILSQNAHMAKKYIVIDETFDENGVRTAYTFHPNLALFTEEERTMMLAYYDFLILNMNTIKNIETSNGISMYTVMNTRAKLDQLIGVIMGGVLQG